MRRYLVGVAHQKVAYMSSSELPISLTALIDAGMSRPLFRALTLTVDVDTKSADDPAYSSNVFRVQALLCVMEGIGELTLRWPEGLFSKVGTSPNSFPLLACTLLHSRIHHVTGTPLLQAALATTRSRIENTRIGFDWFSEPQALLCADHLGLGRPKDLYASRSAAGIKPREDFEALVFPYIERQLAIDLDEKKAFRWRAAFASVIYELFENTELHGKTDLNSRVLSMSIRGILFRDVPFRRYQPTNRPIPTGARCIEISVFDSGIGYFEKSKGRRLDETIPLEEEWRVLHDCLSTHLDDITAVQAGKGLHGIGLYEVLRALKFLEGAIEIRSGRLHGYRSFLPGDIGIQMESIESPLRPGMPKATLLDFDRKYVKKPTEQPRVIGSAIQVLVPIV